MFSHRFKICRVPFLACCRDAESWVESYAYKSSQWDPPKKIVPKFEHFATTNFSKFYFSKNYKILVLNSVLNKFCAKIFAKISKVHTFNDEQIVIIIRPGRLKLCTLGISQPSHGVRVPVQIDHVASKGGITPEFCSMLVHPETNECLGKSENYVSL